MKAGLGSGRFLTASVGAQVNILLVEGIADDSSLPRTRVFKLPCLEDCLMPRPRLAFVDHGFHAKTGSADFLRESLAEAADVVTLWDEGWRGGLSVTAERINTESPDAVLFFQLLPSRKALRGLVCKNITHVPMRDAGPLLPRQISKLRRRQIKLLLFCREHACAVAGRTPSFFAQYFPPLSEPLPPAGQPGPLRVFFWQRVASPDMETVRSLMGEWAHELVYKFDPDPGQAIAPVRHDDETLTVLKGWLTEEDFLRHLRSCQIFIAPRALEGIGQATLDAMKNGLCVVAPDAPTANEYIQHGKNGLLYDIAEPRPLDFSNLSAMQAASRSSVQAGRLRWLDAQPALRQFVLESKRPSRFINWMAAPVRHVLKKRRHHPRERNAS